ncbi:hypothetical protein BDD12DRAFT_807460 [Trichophaea hybrida]|nr:hypothetical protein BDD12DRAFT_807460 [Trichophaea hybrida]
MADVLLALQMQLASETFCQGDEDESQKSGEEVDQWAEQDKEESEEDEVEEKDNEDATRTDDGRDEASFLIRQLLSEAQFGIRTFIFSRCKGTICIDLPLMSSTIYLLCGLQYPASEDMVPALSRLYLTLEIDVYAGMKKETIAGGSILKCFKFF